MKNNLKKLTVCGILCALSVVLVWLVHFPIIPAAPFLEYDPGDIVVILATTMFGLPWGLLITLVVSLVQGLTVSAQSGVYGIIMHVIATGGYVIVYGLCQRLLKKFKTPSMPSMIISCCVAVVTTAALMIIANLLITPLFMQTPREVVQALILPAILPFNLVKFILNSALSVMLFTALRKPLSKFLLK